VATKNSESGEVQSFDNTAVMSPDCTSPSDQSWAGCVDNVKTSPTRVLIDFGRDRLSAQYNCRAFRKVSISSTNVAPLALSAAITAGFTLVWPGGSVARS
jgi:hypothetical protein